MGFAVDDEVTTERKGNDYEGCGPGRRIGSCGVVVWIICNGVVDNYGRHGHDDFHLPFHDQHDCCAVNDNVYR